MTTLTYFIYTALSLTVTVWVARTLFRNGRIFLLDAFGGNKEMADAVNHLLFVGFYLVNIGFIAFFLRFGGRPDTLVELIEYVSTKLGIVLFFLGAAHFFNIFNFARIRRKSKAKSNPEVEDSTPPRPSRRQAGAAAG